MEPIECDRRLLRLTLHTALAHYRILLALREDGPIDEGDMKAQVARIEECLQHFDGRRQALAKELDLS